MHLLEKIKSFMQQPRHRKDAEKSLLKRFERIHGRPFNPSRIETFSEKLLQRLLFVNKHGNKTFTMLADKYRARDYVTNKIGEKYLVNLIWSGKNPNKIPFHTLPEKCVIKTNHGSGGNIIVNNNLNPKEVIEKTSTWLKKNYYWVANEYHYYKIPPRILIEDFLSDDSGSTPLDYRMWCFNGQPKLIQVDNHAHDINNFYDPDWNRLPVKYRKETREVEIPKPENIEEMILVAKKLSEEFDFVRIDLYNLNGKVYFGEITFTPVGGHLKFEPENWDLEIGKMWANKHN